MIAAGVLDKEDYPGFNEETGILQDDDDEEGSDEDVEIDLVEEEPPFLRGQTKQTLQLSPVRIVKVGGAIMRRKGVFLLVNLFPRPFLFFSMNESFL